MKFRRLAVLTASTILVVACGGSNQPNEAQRSALAKPIFPTKYTIVERTTANQPDQRAADVARQKQPKDRNAYFGCLLYTSPSPRDGLLSRMPSSA